MNGMVKLVCLSCQFSLHSAKDLVEFKVVCTYLEST